MMITVWIIVAVMVWYAIGLVGSAIGAGWLKIFIDTRYPQLKPIDTREERLSCFVGAIAGLVNLIMAIRRCRIDEQPITLNWDWIKVGE